MANYDIDSSHEQGAGRGKNILALIAAIGLVLVVGIAAVLDLYWDLSS